MTMNRKNFVPYTVEDAAVLYFIATRLKRDSLGRVASMIANDDSDAIKMRDHEIQNEIDRQYFMGP